jgi:hypothetical protein
VNGRPWKRYGMAAGLVASGVVAGGVLAATVSAGAADGTTATDSSTSQTDRDPSQPRRPDEELLTGDTKSRVEEAVLAEYPDATIERTETDSAGVHESHIVTADGERLIVQVGENFSVTGTETGGGHDRGHRGGPDDQSDGN